MSLYDVVIIGAGPSGLGVAQSLEKNNISNYVVLEREDHAGGIPFHCNHPTFGWLSKGYGLTGPNFINNLLKDIPSNKIRLNTTVLKIHKNGELDIHSVNGISKIKGKRIVICTGTRERSRAARLISGLRPIGIFTTSALQQFVYINKDMPFKKPIIIGSEHVGFSALWTLRNAGIKPIAMIEPKDRIQTFWPLDYFGMLMGTKLKLNTSLVKINGLSRVESVTIKQNGNERDLPCDSVIFCGDFVAENTIVRESHIKFKNPDVGPLVYKDYKTSDPYVYACGNLIHPADMGDRCYKEGKRLGQIVSKDLKLNGEHALNHAYHEVQVNENIYHIFPSLIDNYETSLKFRFRVKENNHHTLEVSQNGKITAKHNKNYYMHRFYRQKVNDIENDDLKFTLN